MKYPLLSILALALACAQAAGAESASLEAAQKAALKLKAALGTLSDAPLAIAADSEQPSLLKAGDESGIMFVPDKKLSSETLAAAGGTIVPLGQLWMRKLVLAPGGKASATEQLRSVTVSDSGKEATVLLFLVGFAKSASGTPELVLYAKGQEPLHRTPLETINGVKGEVPVQLSGRKAGEGTGLLTIDILGQYQAELTVKSTPGL